LIDFFADVAIAVILMAGGFYGYKKGLVDILFKPLKSTVRLFAAVSLCFPMGNLVVAPIISPVVSAGINPSLAEFVTGAISVLIAFTLIMTFGGLIISSISGAFSSLFEIGILGKINSVAGLIFTSGLTFVTLSFIVSVFVSENFLGGPLFRLIKSIEVLTNGFYVAFGDGMDYK
jgi:hypothetical protein